MTDERYRFFFEMLEQSGQIREKIFMLLTAARARPFTVAMTAQIDRHGMLDRHAAFEQCFEKLIPASPLVAHAVNEYVGLFFCIAPFPAM